MVFPANETSYILVIMPGSVGQGVEGIAPADLPVVSDKLVRTIKEPENIKSNEVLNRVTGWLKKAAENSPEGLAMAEYVVETMDMAREVLKKTVPDLYVDAPVVVDLAPSDRNMSTASRAKDVNGNYVIRFQRLKSEMGNPTKSTFSGDRVSGGLGEDRKFDRGIIDLVAMMHEWGHVAYSETVAIDSVNVPNYLNTVDAAISEGVAQYIGLKGVVGLLNKAQQFGGLSSGEIDFLKYNLERRTQGLMHGELAAFYVDGAYLIDKIVAVGDKNLAEFLGRVDGELAVSTTMDRNLAAATRRNPVEELEKLGIVKRVGRSKTGFGGEKLEVKAEPVIQKVESGPEKPTKPLSLIERFRQTVRLGEIAKRFNSKGVITAEELDFARKNDLLLPGVGFREVEGGGFVKVESESKPVKPVDDLSGIPMGMQEVYVGGVRKVITDLDTPEKRRWFADNYKEVNGQWVANNSEEIARVQELSPEIEVAPKEPMSLGKLVWGAAKVVAPVVVGAQVIREAVKLPQREIAPAPEEVVEPEVIKPQKPQLTLEQRTAALGVSQYEGPIKTPEELEKRLAANVAEQEAVRIVRVAKSALQEPEPEVKKGPSIFQRIFGPRPEEPELPKALKIEKPVFREPDVPPNLPVTEEFVPEEPDALEVEPTELMGPVESKPETPIATEINPVPNPTPDLGFQDEPRIADFVSPGPEIRQTPPSPSPEPSSEDAIIAMGHLSDLAEEASETDMGKAEEYAKRQMVLMQVAEQGEGAPRALRAQAKDIIRTYSG